MIFLKRALTQKHAKSSKKNKHGAPTHVSDRNQKVPKVKVIMLGIFVINKQSRVDAVHTLMIVMLFELNWFVFIGINCLWIYTICI